MAWMVESKGGRDQNSVAYFGRLAGDKQRTFGTFSVVKQGHATRTRPLFDLTLVDGPGNSLRHSPVHSAMYSEPPCPLAHLLVYSLLTSWCPLLYYPYSTRAHLLTDLSEKEAPSRASVCSTTLVRV